MTRISTSTLRASSPSTASDAASSAPANAKPRAVDTLAAPAKAATATQRFAELKAAIPADLIGHGSDGEPFFTLASFQPKASEADLLAALASRIYGKRSEIADKHEFLPGTGDAALKAFAARATDLRGSVPAESQSDFDSAVAKTQRLFFNTTLFAEVRAVATSTHGPQYGRDALTLLAKAHTGTWFAVSLQLVG